MKISKNTFEVLKNFSEINENLLIKPGNKLKTISVMKNTLAEASVEETFDKEFAIYDLNSFLSVLSLYEAPEISFSEDYLTVSQGKSSSKFWYADPSLVVSPTKDIKMPPVDVSFTLTQTDLSKVKKASAVMQLPDITVTAESGGDIFLTAVDSKNSTSNDYSVKVGDNAPADFTFHFKAENFKLIDGDYDVEISKSLISHFKHRSKNVEYWIALEQTSKYGG